MGSLSRISSFSGKYLTRSAICKNTSYFRNSPKVLFHTSLCLDVKGQEIKMPSLSPTMSEGTIVKWLKKEGDPVAAGDVLCDIQTDKAVVSMETEEDGILAKIIIPEDTKDIKVGTLIALMVGEGEDWKSVELPSGSSSSSASEAPVSEQSSEPTVSSGPPVTVIKMPSLSPTMSEGTIVKWLKKEGDTIAPGDVLCDIQTDKAVMSMETEEEGILAKILMPDDSKDVKIGTMIALIVAEGEDWKSAVAPSSSAASAPSSQSAPSPAPVKSSHADSPSVSFGPAVRSLLEIYQLNPSSIAPSGPNNKLLKSDVLTYVNNNRLQKKPPKTVPPPSVKGSQPATTPVSVVSKPKAKPGERYVDIELSNVRKVIAKRLSQSKQEIPHAYGSVQCNIDKLLALRKQLQQDGIKVSVNDVVIKAAAAALEQCPEVNAVYEKGNLRSVSNVDISVAVATDNGLITPIVKSANNKSIKDISSAVRELAGKARAGKLKPDEFQGGSFTISNLGMFGITEFSAIINPPQVAILAVGGGITNLDADLKPRTDLRVTLSFDSRAVSDADAARFLQIFRQFLENPTNILTGIPESAELNEETAVL